MATGLQTLSAGTCQSYTTTKAQKWLCCGNTATSKTTQQTPITITQNNNCQAVDSYTTKISHITELPCFTTAWYSTVSGKVQYLKTEGGAYYTTKGGETYYTTGVGNLVPIIDGSKVQSDIIMATTHMFSGVTRFCGKFQQSNQYSGNGADQPLTNFTASMFKISNGQKTYYDYQRDQAIPLLINFHDYNLRNFIKIGNYFELKGGTGYIDGITNNSTRLMTPYCGTIPHTINFLTTLVSHRLIEITKQTGSLNNYIKNLVQSSNLILLKFYKQMVAQICKTYNLNWKNPEDKKLILFTLTYINSQSPFLLSLFQNWYLNQFSDISIYCLQLSVKISFFLSQLQQLLGNLNVEMNDYINSAFYDTIWKYMIGRQKLTMKQLNKIFSVFTNGVNVFPNYYCSIIRKWFKIIDNTTVLVDLILIEIGTKTMTQEALYNASLCPKSILYYKRLLELQFSIDTIRLKTHDYITTIGTLALQESSNVLSDTEKLQIIKHGLEQRIKRIIG